MGESGKDKQLQVAIDALKQIQEKGCRNCGSYSVHRIADGALKTIQGLEQELLEDYENENEDKC